MSNFQDLQAKASAFFDQYSAKYSSAMKCSRGCSDCCYTDLSIMAWEASLLEQWFTSLAPDLQDQLKERWRNMTQQPRTKLVFGQQARACIFLDTSDGTCTIYEARPIICRTQGVAMQWLEHHQKHRSWCEHNFSTQNHVHPQEADDLNLDTLNTMISKAQLLWQQQNDDSATTRVSLVEMMKALMA